MEQESGFGSLILWGTVAVFFNFMSGFEVGQFAINNTNYSLLLASGYLFFGIQNFIRFKKTRIEPDHGRNIDDKRPGQKAGLGNLILWGAVAVGCTFLSGCAIAQFKMNHNYSSLLWVVGLLIFGIVGMIYFKKAAIN